MNNQLKVIVGLFLSLFILKVYAIQINVQSSSKEVFGLGFAINGKDHGGAGKTYSITGMPVGGLYNFGVRVGGPFGNDVDCLKQGKKFFVLKTDTTAVLTYLGSRCTLQIYSRKR